MLRKREALPQNETAQRVSSPCFLILILHSAEVRYAFADCDPFCYGDDGTSPEDKRTCCQVSTGKEGKQEKAIIYYHSSEKGIKERRLFRGAFFLFAVNRSFCMIVFIIEHEV